jgi:hypothetical protein
VATIASTRNGARSSLNVIRFARLRDCAAALPNQLKPITSFQFVRAAEDLRFRMDKALASVATHGRRRQKTPISLDAKSRGAGLNLYKSKAWKPPSYLPTHRREIEKFAELPLSPMESVIK